MVTASRDLTLKVWDLGTGTLLQTLTGHTDEVYGVSMSPDGQWLASTGRDTTVRLWRRQPDGQFANEPERILQLPEDQRTWNRAVTFSPDGQKLAVAGYDRMIRLWNWQNETYQTLEGHGAVVYGVSFSEQGDFLASASGDQTVKVWDVQGRLRLTLSGHTDWVFDVAFRPGTNQLASASADRQIILWNGELQLQSLLQRACGIAQFYLQYNARVAAGDRTLCENVGSTGIPSTAPAFTGQDLSELEQGASTPITREGEFGEPDSQSPPLPREDRFGEGDESDDNDEGGNEAGGTPRPQPVENNNRNGAPPTSKPEAPEEREPPAQTAEEDREPAPQPSAPVQNNQEPAPQPSRPDGGGAAPATTPPRRNDAGAGGPRPQGN